MRKVVWQRWVFVFLLVSRLVLGELGHAMPAAAMAMDSMSASMPAIDGKPAPCPEHESAQHAGAAQGSSHHLADASDDGARDCCKSGDCECPCLHVPCAVTEAAAVAAVHSVREPLIARLDGLALQRPSGLFRPPA